MGWELDSDQTFGLDWYLFESRQASSHLRLSLTKFVTWTRWPGKEKNRKDSRVHLSTNDVVVWFDPILALCRFLFSPPQDYWEGVAGCRKFQKSEVAHAIYFCVWYRMIKYLWPFETHKHIYAQRRLLRLLLGVKVFKNAFKLILAKRLPQVFVSPRQWTNTGGALRAAARPW